MRIIVGLGNPGKEYKDTRHNAGYFFADKLSKNLKSGKLSNLGRVRVFKSDRFMNQSGEFVRQLVSLYPNFSYSNLYIVHDDLDFPLGDFKIQFGRGPKEHNGLRSIDEALGTSQYWHVRIGIDNRQKGETSFTKAMDGKEYVLQNFTGAEKGILDKVIVEVCKKLETL